jgi:hypothetical protein
MLLVQLWINNTRDVWKFAKLDSPRRLVQFWQNFETSLVLLIPNCTRHRMIPYTKSSTGTFDTNVFCDHDIFCVCFQFDSYKKVYSCIFRNCSWFGLKFTHVISIHKYTSY